MALNAGEVEVLLKLRDELSAQLKAAKENLKDSGNSATVAGNALKSMGDVGTKGFQDINKEAKEADKVHGTMVGTVKTLAVAFGAMFTARAAFNFAAKTLEEASALRDLSQQTHINVEELQLIAAAMKEFGVDADTLAKGLYRLSKGVAGGDESVVHGLRLMGMSLKDVDGLNGQALFLKIEGGLAKLQGGLRDTAAAELFGSRLGAAMAGASEGIEEAMDTARRLNTVMSKESVDALDQYGESIDRAKDSLAAMGANMLGPLAQGFNVITDAATKGASKWDIFKAVMTDYGKSNIFTGQSTSALAKVLDEANQKLNAAAAATKKATEASQQHGPALSEEGRIAKLMADLQSDATETLTTTQKKNLATLKDLNQLTVQNAKDIGVSAEQFAKYTAELQKADEAEKKAVAATEKFNDAMIELRSSGDGWKGTLATIDPILVSSIRSYLEAGVSQASLATAYGLTATQIKAVASALTDEGSALKLENKMLVDTEKMWGEYNQLKVEHGGTALQAQLAQIKQWADSEALAARQAGITDKSYYDALEALSREKSTSLSVDWAAIGENSKASLQETADKAQATFQYMLDHSDQFSSETINKFWATADAARAAADGWDTAFSGALEDVGQKVTAATLSWSEAMSLVNQGQGTMTGTIQNAPNTPAQRQIIQQMWNEGRYYGPVLNGNQANPHGTGPDWAALGYAKGGPTKEGPAYLHDDEYVVPKGGALVKGGGGGERSMIVQLVLSDGRELARAVVPWIPGELRRIGVA